MLYCHANTVKYCSIQVLRKQSVLELQCLSITAMSAILLSLNPAATSRQLKLLKQADQTVGINRSIIRFPIQSAPLRLLIPNANTISTTL
jgi:hypothetical protein